MTILGAVLVRMRPFPRLSAQSAAPQSTQSPQSAPSQSPASPQQQQPPAPSVPAQLPLTPQQAPPPIPPPVVHVGPTVILDPAHGGTDSGARGGAGAIEKDLVLPYARVVRNELERQNFRVVLTRDGDSNPSYDDRASVANAYRGAIFISLHVASTGAPGTAHVYYYRFGSSPEASQAGLDTSAPQNASPATTLVSWEEAQLPHIATSHKLADMLQVELARRFNGSPAVAAGVAVRGLRSVDVPAVAIELSSVSAQDPNTLAAMAGPLAISIARGVQMFRGTRPSGEN
jgi:N-acetylmuramoyl-L-alanine amidase